MTNLVSAYMRNEIREFEVRHLRRPGPRARLHPRPRPLVHVPDAPPPQRILKRNQRTVLGDDFIRLYLEDLLKNIRTQARDAREMRTRCARGERRGERD